MIASEDGTISKLFFNPKDLIVLSKSIRTAWSSRLDFTGAEASDQIANEVIFGLTGSMGNHDAPSCSLRHIASLDGLSYGADLVHLEEKRVAKLFVDSSLNSLWVSDEEVITDNLDSVSHLLGHFDVRSEVVLIKRVFDRNNWVSVSHTCVEIDELVGSHNSIGGADLL